MLSDVINHPWRYAQRSHPSHPLGSPRTLKHKWLKQLWKSLNRLEHAGTTLLFRPRRNTWAFSPPAGCLLSSLWLHTGNSELLDPDFFLENLLLEHLLLIGGSLHYHLRFHVYWPAIIFCSVPELNLVPRSCAIDSPIIGFHHGHTAFPQCWNGLEGFTDSEVTTRGKNGHEIEWFKLKVLQPIQIRVTLVHSWAKSCAWEILKNFDSLWSSWWE